MSGVTGASGGDGDADAEVFAELLSGLKERSGLSYGALAKRLHMSTSTLHRYCIGSTTPADYAPVQRMARVCRATPQELVELHRCWVLADAARRRKAGAGGTARERAGPPLAPAVAGAQFGGGGANDGPHDAPEGEPAAKAPAPSPAPRTWFAALPRPGRRPVALGTAAVAAAVLGVAVLAVNMSASPNGSGREAAPAPAVGTGSTTGRADSARPSPSASPDGSRSAQASLSPAPGEPSAPRPTPDSSAPSAEERPDAVGGERGGGASSSGASVSVVTRPYVYDGPCSQHFLVNSEPAQVGPPPATEQDAPRWAAAYDAVSSGEQRVAVTLQGSGKETVVLGSLQVRVLTKSTPLAWNDYAMGSGCGGRVESASFDVDLDAGSPTVAVRNGQRAFPYSVTETDPLVFYVTAHTRAHDVRWDLTLKWSSGSRQGTVHIDNNGAPFRTSSRADRPGFEYPLGGGEWIRREE
ncbi:helix-turn-helix domain-containing protein [Streptomyces sp. JJ66]|uniref:transcriptional regulator n=1 Tax=Streptomyces sp. JJ66 TaxID=2803843 RepID=UPI001C565728|nr:transcriptional regulator [Streptomyces sp. JJ66]MBW1603407.1 helix-turn-helix domain-containing protein [Streptomyces sp. JJ66]